jgi:hypothetical protein
MYGVDGPEKGLVEIKEESYWFIFITWENTRVIWVDPEEMHLWSRFTRAQGLGINGFEPFICCKLVV